MREAHLKYLACPTCREALSIAEVSQRRGDSIETGVLQCAPCDQRFEIQRHIPRFVPQSSYADGFGFQWQKHAKTQHDWWSHSDVSETRFFNETKWPRRLDGEAILEVGCGSGRFTHHALSTGATVVAMDLSSAVDANYACHPDAENLLLVQSDIYQMPFPYETFDRLFCFGVLQHTPDVKESFMALPRFLKPSGSLAVDVYDKRSGLLGILEVFYRTYYWVRPFTRRMPPEKLYRWVDWYINRMWPVTRWINRIPVVGRKLNRMLLVVDYRGRYRLSEQKLKEWSVLDTFDMLSPAYDQRQTIKTFTQWFHEAPLDEYRRALRTQRHRRTRLQMLTPTIDHALSRPTHRRTSRLVLLATGLLGLLVVVAGVHVVLTGQLPFLRRESIWSVAIYEGPSPFQLAPIAGASDPVLTAADVTDVPAMFVADPFMLQADSTWYMFFEVLNKNANQGDIGLAKSTDGVAWEYEKIVLDEPFHLSYPSVFRWQDKYFMVPESEEAGEVRLYEATSFPFQWKHTNTLLTGERLADPTIFQHDDRWWLFVGASYTHDKLRLFMADDVKGPWTEHPQSPLIDNQPDIARPGGPVTEYEGQLYRLCQDCSPNYGNQLMAYRITQLTTTAYAEEPLESGPFLKASGKGWNAVGMHHSDAHQLSNQLWRACVDGHKKVWMLRF